jgi:hypothetical protein
MILLLNNGGIIHMNDNMTDTGRRIFFGEGKATREPSSGKGRFDLISPYMEERLAKWMEKGAEKYDDWNWSKGGIPFHRFIDSARRHLNKYMMGLQDEDHLCGVLFNIMAIIHFEELNQMEDNDLPKWRKNE